MDRYDEFDLEDIGAGKDSLLYEGLDKLDSLSWFRGTVLNQLPDIIKDTFQSSSIHRITDYLQNLDGDPDVSNVEALYLAKTMVQEIEKRNPGLLNEPSEETIEQVRKSLPEELRKDEALVKSLATLQETSLEDFEKRLELVKEGKPLPKSEANLQSVAPEHQNQNPSKWGEHFADAATHQGEYENVTPIEVENLPPDLKESFLGAAANDGRYASLDNTDVDLEQALDEDASHDDLSQAELEEIELMANNFNEGLAQQQKLEEIQHEAPKVDTSFQLTA